MKGRDAPDALLHELYQLRDAHRKTLDELLDPSMKLFHERNGGLEETTEPFIALARSTVESLDRLIENIGERDA